jgi:hypothetical protein
MNSELRDVEAAISGSAVVLKSDWGSGEMRPHATCDGPRLVTWQCKRAPFICRPITLDEQCEVMADYLLACLSSNPASDDFIHSGFEAGHALASCLKHWSAIPAASDVIAIVVKRLAELYRESDAEGRNRIETGALEHMLEAPRLRSYFEHWAQDAELREAYEPALAWGRAHSDDAG